MLIARGAIALSCKHYTVAVKRVLLAPAEELSFPAALGPPMKQRGGAAPQQTSTASDEYRQTAIGCA